MKNGLVLINSSSSMIFIPGNSVRFIWANSSATDLQINYEGEDKTEGSANVTVTSGKMDEVIKELSRILSETTGVFTVADDENSIYMPNVTAVTGITVSA
jgi:hypothetical protein